MSFAKYRRVPYAERPLAFLDVEGNGIIPGYHELTEIGIKHTELGQFHRMIHPKHMDRSQEKALVVSRYSKADWANAQPFEEVFQELKPYLMDCTIVGHNIWNYDIPMIRGNLEMIGVRDHEEWLSRDIIDTMVLARTLLVPEGLKNISMRACRKFFGREYDGAHNALEDCFFNEELYNDIMSRVSFKPLQPKQVSLF